MLKQGHVCPVSDRAFPLQQVLVAVVGHIMYGTPLGKVC